MYGDGKKSTEIKMQKQSEDKTIKNIKYLFKIKQENEAVKGRIIRDIKNLLKQDHYKPVSAGNFYSNNCIEDERIPW